MQHEKEELLVLLLYQNLLLLGLFRLCLDNDATKGPPINEDTIGNAIPVEWWSVIIAGHGILCW